MGIDYLLCIKYLDNAVNIHPTHRTSVVSVPYLQCTPHTGVLVTCPLVGYQRIFGTRVTNVTDLCVRESVD